MKRGVGDVVISILHHLLLSSYFLVQKFFNSHYKQLNITTMPSAKQQALKDIKTALKKEGRCFLAFRRELNTPIKEIVKDYLNKQKELK